MCEFCAEHGEGKRWYLSMKNYSRELLADPQRRNHIAAFFKDFEHSVAGSLSMLDSIQALPFVPDVVSKIATSRQKKGHFGQVVPIEDVDKILDQMTSVVRLPCVCRSLTTGRREVRYCYGLNLDPAGLVTQYPDFDNNLEWLAVADARSAIHGLDKEGLVHSVWTFDTPFIGGLCNCDQDCMAYRMQVGTGMMQVFFAADYVAAIDWDKCTGCKLCRGQCPFGAIRYTATQDKCQIDANLCYGCGVCRGRVTFRSNLDDPSCVGVVEVAAGADAQLLVVADALDYSAVCSVEHLAVYLAAHFAVDYSQPDPDQHSVSVCCSVVPVTLVATRRCVAIAHQSTSL